MRGEFRDDEARYIEVPRRRDDVRSVGVREKGDWRIRVRVREEVRLFAIVEASLEDVLLLTFKGIVVNSSLLVMSVGTLHFGLNTVGSCATAGTTALATAGTVELAREEVSA